MSDLVLDASVALQWFLDDEVNRKYSLAILGSLSDKRALVPILWFYEVGNGLLMAHRRNRISVDQMDQFLTRLKALPIDAAQETPAELLQLPMLAQRHGLTNYDAAYLGLASQSGLPLATTDAHLVRAAKSAGLSVFTL
ncbi:MAG TPA: type II toxin-antitoxin system VapC family toxin [Terriglobales bacterium]|nr:type II toxin-antitoxin system VapC family toxin [Terriglobales bacterium]